MSRVAKQQIIPMKAYRHFAVVTLVITLALAVFADGENREAIGSKVEEHQEEADLQRASDARFANAPDNVAPIAPQFGDEIPAGKPAFTMRPATGSVLPAGQNSTGGGLVAQAQAIGYPPEVLAAMSPREREQALKGLLQAGMLQPAQRNRRIAALTASSAARSGSSVASIASDLR